MKEFHVLDPKDFEQLSKKLYESLPESLKSFESDIQSRFQDILKVAFQKMDLVTRDEFDVQVKVLLRTREKLEALEKKVAQLSSASPNNKKNNEDD